MDIKLFANELFALLKRDKRNFSLEIYLERLHWNKNLKAQDHLQLA